MDKIPLAVIIFGGAYIYLVGVWFAISGSKLLMRKINREEKDPNVLYFRIPFSLNFVSWLVVIIWCGVLWLHYDLSAKFSFKRITKWYYSNNGEREIN